MSALGQRVAVAVVGIPPLLWAATSQHSAPVTVLAAALALGCSYELLSAEGFPRASTLLVSLAPAVFLVLAAPLPALAAIGLVGALLFHVLPLPPRLPLRAVLGAVLWVAVPLTSLRLLNPATTEGNLFEVQPTPLLMVFTAIWAADTFAFFVGRAVGQHPLAPRISPKKTVEGAVAGFVGAALVTGSAFTWMGGAFWPGALFGAVLAVAGIVGDLLESRWKRSLDTKDSGGLLPGHGGLLDRFDSLLLAAPVGALLLPLLHQLR